MRTHVSSAHDAAAPVQTQPEANGRGRARNDSRPSREPCVFFRCRRIACATFRKMRSTDRLEMGACAGALVEPMELVAAIKQYMEQIQGLMQVQGSQIDEVVAGQALEDCRIIAKEARQTVGQFTRVHPHASLRCAGGLEMVFFMVGREADRGLVRRGNAQRIHGSADSGVSGACAPPYAALRLELPLAF